MPRQTLEQQRAADAWACSAPARYRKEHVTVAKSLPALIANSGLMQVLAYCQSKGDPYRTVADDLRRWLVLSAHGPHDAADFAAFMARLMQVSPVEYQQLTAEAFAWLRWLRQIAPARQPASASRHTPDQGA